VAQLVLGPILRYVDETDATVWVETDAACEVDVLGRTSRTFEVAGHHFALVCIGGLEPGTATPYEVRLDDEVRWPEDDMAMPPSYIRTPGDEPAKIVFGSCRVVVPHEPPYSLRKDQDPRGREIDALFALAMRMRETPVEDWPTRLLMVGDQVYADEVSPRTGEFIRARRDTSVPPGEEVADFEEYTQLYREAWSEPTMRWLMSTVATAMIFDDHDVHDDWNISASWVEDARALDWWDKRIVGAFMSYWIYQHLGNLAPAHLHEDEMYDRVCGADGDAAQALAAFASKADREVAGARWSFCRDYGGVRVMVIDSRAGRVLDGRRSMFDDDEWQWLCERLTGDVDHLVVATTLPVLLGQGMHFLEAWNEAVCDGAWGGLAAKLGEKIRRGLDLEHWAAFGDSFTRLTDRLREVAAGEHGRPPASIVLVSGDVHHAYLTEVAWPKGTNAVSPVYQAVCSPFRNPLDAKERRMIRFGTSRPAWAIGRLLARAAGVRDPNLRWRMLEGPHFDNQVATLTLHERHGTMTLERTRADDPDDRPGLHECFSRRLA
jgi:hypothetical protein